MGMWQGLYMGLQNARESQRLRQEREDRLRMREEDVAFRREEMDFRREQFEAQQARSRREMISELLPNLRERTVASQELASRAEVLRGYFPESPIVDTLLSTGNPEALDRVISNIEQGFEEAERQQSGGGQAFLDQYRTTLENDYRITPATVMDLDLSLLDVTPEEFEAMGFERQFTVPGGVEGRPVFQMERGGLEDYERVERRIANSALDQANLEIQRIDAGLAQLSEALEQQDLDQNLRANYEETRQALVGRRQQVDTAIDMATGDNASPAGVLRLYGNDAATRILGGANVALDPEFLSPAFTDNIGRQPLAVTSEEQALMLMRLGVIQSGDIILVDGRESIA